jgi:hypothetical protein
MKHPGDPTPRSASEVLADRSYKMVFSNQSPQLSGQIMNMLVVFHCGSETYWTVMYPVMRDGDAMTWQEVVPTVETITTYRPVP